MLHQPRIEPRPETIRHDRFDGARDLGLGIPLPVHELDRHALIRRTVAIDIVARHDPLDLAVDRERVGAAGDEQLEQKLGADG